MNVMKVREVIKKMHRNKVMSDAAFKRLIYAPVFLYDVKSYTLNAQEMAWCKEHVMDKKGGVVPTMLPYKYFTIWHPGVNGDRPCVICVMAEPHRRHYESSVCDGTPSGEINALVTLFTHDLFFLKDGKTHECVTVASLTGVRNKGAIIQLYRDWKIIPSDVILADKDALDGSQELVAHSLLFLTKFAYDVMSKTSAVIRVQPNGNGQSVEWTLSKTHYCILNRKQAMSIRDKRNPITLHQITRAAGWRKAHFRKLRAECFTKKRGLEVPVREAWVGPEEWIGLDDKLYKVML